MPFLCACPFYQATKMLSGRQYPTLSLAFVIQKMLHNFLKSDREKEDIVHVFHLKQVKIIKKIMTNLKQQI